VAEDLLNRFDDMIESKKKAVEEEMERILGEVLERRKSEVIYTRDKALKQIMQLIKAGT
jgi:ubiquinone biosynthesis protein UbiJ